MSEKLWIREFRVTGMDLPPPGAKRDSSDEEIDRLHVEYAMKEIIESLRNPYKYEALQQLLFQNHILVGMVKPGRRFGRMGSLARWVIEQCTPYKYLNQKNETRGRKKRLMPGIEKLLIGLEKRRQKEKQPKNLKQDAERFVEGRIAGKFLKPMPEYRKKQTILEVYKLLVSVDKRARRISRK